MLPFNLLRYTISRRQTLEFMHNCDRHNHPVRHIIVAIYMEIDGDIHGLSCIHPLHRSMLSSLNTLPCVLFVCKTRRDMTEESWLSLDYITKSPILEATLDSLPSNAHVKMINIERTWKKIISEVLVPKLKKSNEERWSLSRYMFVLSLVMMTFNSVLIVSFFNKFTLLREGELRTKIETLASSLNFPLKKLFDLDGSTWSSSSHNNILIPNGETTIVLKFINEIQGIGLKFKVVHILRVGLALAKHASSILPATKTYL